ncbi:hypothetical protein U1Q18_036555, partial [Sarracenia purpurea var. burkii]
AKRLKCKSGLLGYRSGIKFGDKWIRVFNGRKRNAEETGGGDVGLNGLEEAEGASGDEVDSAIRDLKTDGDMGLGGEIVDLVGEDSVNPAARCRSAVTAKENGLGN